MLNKYQEEKTKNREKYIIMKNTIKLLLVVALFCSTAFADDDGNMGNGGRNCPTGTTCLIEGQDTDTKDGDREQADESVLDIVRDYLFSIFG